MDRYRRSPLPLMIVTVPVYTPAGLRIHASPGRGCDPLHAVHHAGDLHRGSTKVLQVTDRIIKQFPEVDRVLGKAGRAETATDPAPLSMLETLITLRPERGMAASGYLVFLLGAAVGQKDLWPHHSGSYFPGRACRRDEPGAEPPGLANGWTMPIKGRIEMLSTGIRTPVGLKISGADVATIEQIGTQIEAVLPAVKGTRSVLPSVPACGYFLDFKWNQELARYGISIDEAQQAHRAGHRRGECDHYSGRERTLPGQCALYA